MHKMNSCKNSSPRVAQLLGNTPLGAGSATYKSVLQGRRVLVTGGGGSIGQELCRRVADCQPAELIILDIYENTAYEIAQELGRKYGSSLPVRLLIASIRDKDRIDAIFEKYRPEIVLHAAAHKHVPLMEENPAEAIKNNVFGSKNVFDAAEKYGSEKCILISTDKAVNPTSVMGASKQMCERMLSARRESKTTFATVRFGNVADSNGSVMPLFRRQIAEGGPVTVTDKRATRYFMSIAEACHLVLQATAMAKGGEVFVLDMGEPVKIYDLAYNLIKLSGLEPFVDIDIVCTGLRPGEKLYEERLMADEGLQRTENELISIGKPLVIDEDFLWKKLDELYEQAYNETSRMKELVAELVPTYTIDKR